MTIYEDRRHTFIEKYKMSPTNSTIASTLIARLVVSSFMLPMEGLRVRLSNSVKMEKGQHFNLKGLKATLVRDLVYSSLFWLTFENIRNWYVSGEYRHSSGNDQPFMKILENNIVPSVIAGSLISGITTPLDTIKTRIQSNKSSSNSIMKEIVQIYRN